MSEDKKYPVKLSLNNSEKEYKAGDAFFIPVGSNDTLPLVPDSYQWVDNGGSLHVNEYVLEIRQLKFDF